MPSKKSPSPTDVYVGSRVRVARSMAGISQMALGAELNITFQQIQKYEKGTNRISASKLLEISHILNKPISWFFDGLEDDKTPDTSLERAFQTADGSRTLRAFVAATAEQRRMIANVVTTMVATPAVPAE